MQRMAGTKTESFPRFLEGRFVRHGTGRSVEKSVASGQSLQLPGDLLLEEGVTVFHDLQEVQKQEEEGRDACHD